MFKNKGVLVGRIPFLHMNSAKKGIEKILPTGIL